MTDQAATSTATANIGVVGLAVMGSTLARKLASRDGNTVAIVNRSADKTSAGKRLTNNNTFDKYMFKLIETSKTKF